MAMVVSGLFLRVFFRVCGGSLVLGWGFPVGAVLGFGGSLFLFYPLLVFLCIRPVYLGAPLTFYNF